MLLLLLVAPVPATGHIIDPSSVDQSVELRVDASGGELTIRVSHGELHALPLLRAADVAGDANGIASSAELHASALPFCARYLESIVVTIFGEPFGTQAAEAAISSRIESTRIGLYQLDCRASVEIGEMPIPVGSEISLASRYLAESPGSRYFAIAYKRAPRGFAEMVGRTGETRLTVTVGSIESPDAPPPSIAPSPLESLLPSLPVRLPADLGGGLLALGFAFLVGALHALTPGHGKTLIGAALLGRRASPARALMLGASVSVAHTIGVLAMALLVSFATAELVGPIARALPLAAALIMVGIALSMLREALRAGDGDVHDHHHASDHAHTGEELPGSLRALFLLGLSGGIVPSASALVVLISAIASGAAAWGVLVVLAFGAGMAAVMSTLALLAGRLGARLDRAEGLGHRIAHRLPLASALLVLVLALGLTLGAL